MKKKTKNWFESWFDSKYYHILYQHRDEVEAKKFISNIVSYLDLPTESVALDLACGKGRHSIYLSQFYNNVKGVDLSPQSIEKAKEFQKEGLHFDIHDMREALPENTYDVIFNLFTSFGYFENLEEDLTVLKSVKSGLKQDGIFVLDFLNPEKVKNNLTQEEIKTVDGIEFHIKRSYEDPFIKKQIKFKDNKESFEYTEQVNAISMSQFKKLFQQAGLEIISTFGTYDLEAYQADKSDRMIFITKKS